jgi:hypothetical protein
MHDALCVIAAMMTEKRTVLGAGCSDVVMADAVDAQARDTKGKIALSMDAFARALRQKPLILAANAGLDAPEILAHIRAEHTKGRTTFRLDLVATDVGTSSRSESLRASTSRGRSSSAHQRQQNRFSGSTKSSNARPSGRRDVKQQHTLDLLLPRGKSGVLGQIEIESFKLLPNIYAFRGLLLTASA